MKSPDLKEWNKQKNEDFFALSKHMLDLFVHLTNYQISEMRLRAENAIAVADHILAGRIDGIEDEQLGFMVKSASHAASLHLNSKNHIEIIQKKIKSNSDACVHKSVDLLAEFIEEGDRKIPVGAKQIADSLRVISDSGDKAYMVGQNLAHIAAQHSDRLAERYLIQEPLE